jgi:beta-galactosidase
MENYADRKRGSDVGLYTSTVRGNMTPYAKPMENGNHEDVRWATVGGKGLPGLMAQAEDGRFLQASVLPYTDEQMDPIEYTIDLPPSTASVLVLGARTTGVGSAGCGPRPADEYIVWSTPASFSYVLRLLTPAQIKEEMLDQGRMQVPSNRIKPVLATRDFNGKVTLTCETTNAKLEYALSEGAWTTYAEPFMAPDAEQLNVRASATDMESFAAIVPLGKLDPRAKWKITASSYEGGEGDPGNAVDGQNGSFWHSRWSGQAAAHPHWLAVDLGHSHTLTGVTVLPRQGENSNGRIKDYEIYLSADGKVWGEPVAKGTWKNSGNEQSATFKTPVKGRHLKLVALSEATGQKFATIAELDVQIMK